MSRIITVAAVSTIVSSFWAAAPADASMIFQQRTSTLTASGLTCGNFSCSTIGSTTTGVTDFAPYSDSLSYMDSSTATQQSTLSATQIEVKSHAMGYPSSAGGADSYFSVQFSLDDTEHYSFTGISMNDSGSGKAQIELIGPNGFDLTQQEILQADPAYNSYSVSGSGTLGPGIYTLVVDAKAVGPGHNYTQTWADAQAELNLQPVPLPAAGLLLLTGLGPLGFLRRARAT